MTPLVIKSDTASGLLLEVLKLLSERLGSYDRSQPRGMPIREFRNVSYHLYDTEQCAAWLPGRNLNYPFMLAEWLWILSGRGDVEMISFYNKQIAQFSDDGVSFFGAYGTKWLHQALGVVDLLKRDPDSRQAVVSLWRELPPQTKDVPCTLSMQYLRRQGYLEGIVTMRSSDAWLGLPYDLFNFAMLQRSIAATLGIDSGCMTVNIGSSHLYDRNLDDATRVVHQAMAGGPKRSSIFVPTPPAINEQLDELTAAEAVYRMDPDVFRTTPTYTKNRWVTFLSLLSYRTHKDPDGVCVPFDDLVRP